MIELSIGLVNDEQIQIVRRLENNCLTSVFEVNDIVIVFHDHLSYKITEEDHEKIKAIYGLGGNKEEKIKYTVDVDRIEPQEKPAKEPDFFTQSDFSRLQTLKENLRLGWHGRLYSEILEEIRTIFNTPPINDADSKTWLVYNALTVAIEALKEWNSTLLNVANLNPKNTNLPFNGNYKTKGGKIAENVTKDLGPLTKFPYYGIIDTELVYFTIDGHAYSSNTTGNNRRLSDFDLAEAIRPGEGS